MISKNHHPCSGIQRFILPFILLLILAACDPDKKTRDTTTTDEPKYQPACPPVNISEFWKLRLPITKYNTLAAQATNGGALVFQFVYDKNATPRLTLVAYAAKPGRDFQPLTLEYLEPLSVSAIPSLGAKFSLGDQKVLFTGPKGLNQLIAGIPAGAVVESLTFTPDKLDTPYGATTVTNIRYKICVRYQIGSDYFEYCGANEVELQPSPPANHGN